MGIILRISVSFVFIFSIFSGVLAFAQNEAVPGEYIVKLRPFAATFDTEELERMLDSEIKEVLPNDLLLLQRSPIENSDFVISNLKTNSVIELIEPNYIYSAVRLTDDPQLPRQWGLRNFGQRDKDNVKGKRGMDIGIEKAWDITTGSKKVIVAVIDTGIDYTHKDLRNNIWQNLDEKNGQPGVDDDGNGYVDDIYGYDFANNDADPMDDGGSGPPTGHGTHCAGVIGAEGNNSTGMSGINWQVSLMAVKFLGSDGSGTLDGAIKAIDYAVKMGAKITSNSWSGPSNSTLLKQAIERANQAGVMFIAAAGNESRNNDSHNSYPANFKLPNLISVAALTNRGSLARFSNYSVSKVHVAAPGQNIYSTLPRNRYASWSGTSMATPFVAGVAALLLAHDSNLEISEIRDRIFKGAKIVSGTKGKVKSGLLNAYNALTNTPAYRDPNDPANWPMQDYALSTQHPYPNGKHKSFKVQIPGAKRVSAYFSRFETEDRFDFVEFTDKTGKELGRWTGQHNGSYSPVADGDTLNIHMKPDKTISKYGFDVSKVAVDN